jgi:NAD-dependent dihydropyrimidine dehydrogenase PreA subunit
VSTTGVRHSIAVSDAACVGCGACVEVCPPDVLRLSEHGKARAAYPDDCQGCFICTMACAFHAIDVHVELDAETRVTLLSLQGDEEARDGR